MKTEKECLNQAWIHIANSLKFCENNGLLNDWYELRYSFQKLRDKIDILETSKSQENTKGEDGNSSEFLETTSPSSILNED